MPALSLVREEGATTLVFGTPILAEGILRLLAEELDHLATSKPPQPLVVASSHPTIFLAGAHLAEIAELDPASCRTYADLGRSVAARLESHPAPVVAAIHGSCSGGGFDLVLACDAVVASPNASFSHPGVVRGLVTGWGGTVRLPAAVGRPAARRALLEGSPFSAAAMQSAGLVHAVADDPRSEARELCRRLHLLAAPRLSLWRRLRGPTFVDRFRAVVVEK